MASGDTAPDRRIVGAVAGQVEDRRLDADRARAAVKDEVDPARRGRRARARRSSGWCARRGWPTGRRRPHPARRASLRANCWSGTRNPTVSRPPVTASGTVRRARDDQRQRTRPERVREGACIRTDPARVAVEHVAIGPVHDQRVAGRPALDGEDPPYGVRALGVGAKPVDRLGRKRDDAAVRQPVGGLERVVGEGCDHRRWRSAPGRGLTVILEGRRPGRPRSKAPPGPGRGRVSSAAMNAIVALAIFVFLLALSAGDWSSRSPGARLIAPISPPWRSARWSWCSRRSSPSW